MIEPPACVRQGWVICMCMLHIFKNIPHNPIGYDIKLVLMGLNTGAATVSLRVV